MLQSLPLSQCQLVSVSSSLMQLCCCQCLPLGTCSMAAAVQHSFRFSRSDIMPHTGILLWKIRNKTPKREFALFRQMLCCAVLCCAVLRCAVLCCAAAGLVSWEVLAFNVVPHLLSVVAQHATARHSTPQHATAQHSTAQHATARMLPPLLSPCYVAIVLVVQQAVPAQLKCDSITSSMHGLITKLAEQNTAYRSML